MNRDIFWQRWDQLCRFLWPHVQSQIAADALTAALIGSLLSMLILLPVLIYAT